ncbi:activator-dependent family glycosyltransferase [Pseudonocardia alni]|uniref:activator-dependent family glycosyltransferase n=1 Tax=Pseudonocardia alni TaxID=33907 RepID=UPI00340576C0|nr:AntC [Pseudonocardia antarctica]
MRILFTTMAERSHVSTMVPLAWALATAGHEVRLAGSPMITETTVSAGLTAVEVGKDHTYHELLGAQDTVEHEMADWSEPFADRQTWEQVLLKYQAGVPYGLAPYNDPIVDDLVEFARWWRPDLVVWDPLTYAGAVAAAAVGAAHARLLWTVDLYTTMRSVLLGLAADRPVDERADPLREWLEPQLDAVGAGFDEQLLTGDFSIDQVPPGVQLDLGALQRVPMRYTAYNGRAVVPPWVHEPLERPRVLLTPGTSFATALGATFVPLRESLDALADLDVEVVATLTAAEQEQVGTVPANTRVVEFVPLHAIMGSCSAVVHHGGFGTWSTAVLHGVPHAVLPIRHGDLWVKGTRTAELGAGLCAHPSTVGAEDLRGMVHRLLTDPAFTTAAGGLRDRMLAMPTPNEVVGDIESLTRAHRR